MKKSTAIIAGVAALALSGCSSVSTAPDQVSLHYKGGSFSSRTFSDCVPASTKDWNGPGDDHYSYPASQRIYDATGGEGAESAPFTVVSEDNAELQIPVTVTFTLITECGVLREFHERLGNRYGAYMDGDDTTEGWVRLLNTIIGKPLDTTLDRIAQEYTWRELWNDPKAKTAIESEVNADLAALVERQAGGIYFDDFQALIQKPNPINQGLKDAIAQEQTSVAKSNAAKAQAEADEARALAEIAVAEAEAAKRKAEIEGFGSVENYLKAKALEKGINPWQPGGSILVEGR